MSASAPHAAVAPRESFVARHHFLLRRLHSLTGIIPVGAFLAEHIFTSSAILLSPEEYQKDISFIWNLPGLVLMEIFLIWVPIFFHGILGLVYTFGGRPNNVAYGYGDNWRYTLQRVTGIIAFAYIFFHLATTRWGWSFGAWETPFDPEQATLTTAQAVQQFGWLPWFFLVGLLANVYHFANGLWTAAITWGLTLSVAAQRRWGYICLAIGLALALAGTGAIYKFATYPLASKAPIHHAAPSSAQQPS